MGSVAFLVGDVCISDFRQAVDLCGEGGEMWVVIGKHVIKGGVVKPVGVEECITTTLVSA